MKRWNVRREDFLGVAACGGTLIDSARKRQLRKRAAPRLAQAFSRPPWAGSASGAVSRGADGPSWAPVWCPNRMVPPALGEKRCLTTHSSPHYHPRPRVSIRRFSLKFLVCSAFSTPRRGPRVDENTPLQKRSRVAAVLVFEHCKRHKGMRLDGARCSTLSARPQPSK